MNGLGWGWGQAEHGWDQAQEACEQRLQERGSGHLVGGLRGLLG